MLFRSYFIIEKAVEQANLADYEKIGYAKGAYEKGIDHGVSPSQLSKLNWNFHIALLEPSDRPRNVAVIRMLYTSLDRYLRMQIRTKKAQAAAVRDHQRIFDAYTARDVNNVLALTKDHIQTAYHQVLKGLKEKQDKPDL